MSKNIHSKESTTYKDAGVNIEAGDELVERIKPLAKKTLRPEVLGGLGGFGSLFEVPKKYPLHLINIKQLDRTWLRCASMIF